jgi:hypothetical protein
MLAAGTTLGPYTLAALIGAGVFGITPMEDVTECICARIQADLKVDAKGVLASGSVAGPLSASRWPGSSCYPSGFGTIWTPTE